MYQKVLMTLFMSNFWNIIKNLMRLRKLIKILGIFGFVNLDKILIEEMGFQCVLVLMMFDIGSGVKKKMAMESQEHLYFKNILKGHFCIKIENLTSDTIYY